MKIFVTLLFLLFATSSEAINYYRCETTDDCIKAYGGCGVYISVHRRYKELYEAKAHKGDTTSFCRPPNEKDNEVKMKGEPLCDKRSCRLVLKEASVEETKTP